MADFSEINERGGFDKKSMWGKFHKKNKMCCTLIGEVREN